MKEYTDLIHAVVVHWHDKYIIQKMTKQNINWYWIIGILLVLALLVIYFWLSGDSGSGVNTATNTGGNIPSPPALPS